MQSGWQVIYRSALVLTLVSLVFWPAYPASCRAETRRIIETRHTMLIFNSTADLERFNRAIRYPGRVSIPGIFSSRSQESSEKELARKVDLLFEKVQQILDMRKEMRKVRVRVFSDGGQLREACIKIFGGNCTVRGWYVYEFNTVYLNAADVHEGMLAHELGHAVIDHYFTTRPPRATAEILARYVDKHLFDEVKSY
jgi:hypothetical protein